MHGQIYVITAIHIYLEVKLCETTTTGARNAAIRLDERNKVVIFKNINKVVILNYSLTAQVK